MKQKRIPANSIIVPLVVVAVVLSALLSFAGFVNAGVIEGGRLVYGIIGMAIICLLGAIAIFAAVIYQRKEACRLSLHCGIVCASPEAGASSLNPGIYYRADLVHHRRLPCVFLNASI